MFDFSSIITWWIVIFGIGLIFLPLTFIIFKNFFDRGYIFSKILGIAVVSYTIFLLGILHIGPFSFLTSVLVLIFFAILNTSFIIRERNDGLKRFLRIIKDNWVIFIFEEILFIFCLLFWSYIRSFQPDIHGLEKYMDFGILNSILRSEFFPPKDIWFTPLSINYYYFGHLTTAVLTKLSNIPSSITFNLMIASIFAFTLVGSFSIGANLVFRSFVTKNSKIQTTIATVAAGLLTGLLVSLCGNLQTIYSFFKNYSGENPVPFWHLPFSFPTFPNNYWYPNATRFIYHTIHEFPLYSFVVSDLHGHVLDIPFVLLIIGLLLSEFLEMRIKISKTTIALISFLLAIMYMTNAWDGIIYFLLAALIFLYPLIYSKLFYSSKKLPLGNWVLTIAILFFGFFIFSYPFNHFFKPFVSGIGMVCPPDFLVKIGKIGPFIFEADHCQKSPWWQIFILYGFFYFWVISFIIFIFKNIKRKKLTIKLKSIEKSDLFVFTLIPLSIILIIIPELMYAKDIYPAHYRANTMFKLVYQSFIMLSIASSYIIIRIITNFKYMYWKFLVFGIGVIGLLLVFIYPYFAINSFYGGLKAQLGLEGTKYLKNLYPTDYEAILWINKNIKGQPVILEAQGDSYTDFARISANTGLPTVLGWTVHEWLWRGTYDIPAPRITEVKTLYETPDIGATRQLINKYKIYYVFIGDLEFQQYPNLNEKKFNKLGVIVYKNGRTKIYKIIAQTI